MSEEKKKRLINKINKGRHDGATANHHPQGVLLLWGGFFEFSLLSFFIDII